MSKAQPIAPGSLLGRRYRLSALIGSGGMATVWRAEDERTGTDVAVKVISDVLAHDPDYLHRFAREVEIAEGLDHPSIVRVLDHDVSAERPFLVMELIEGGTLAAALKEGRPVDGVAVARALLEALERIHGAGVVHRDVKPGNVLIDPEETIKLTDFGIARAADQTRLTMTGHVVGTLKYMAPEVRRGEPADTRSDLYSAGVVIGETTGERRGAALDALVATLTSEAPADRPATATEALALLTPRREPTAETAPLPPARTEPTTTAVGTGGGQGRGSRRLAALAALAAVAVLVAVIALASGGSDGDGGDDRGRSTSTSSTSTTDESTSSTTSSETTTDPTTTEATTPPPPEEKPPPEPKEEKAPKPPKEEKPPKDEKLPPGLEKKDELPPGQKK